MRYRKKPLIVEAYQWFPSVVDKPGVRKIAAHAVNHSRKDAEGKEIGRGIIHEAPDQWVVDTREGPLHVSPGDWIIKGVKGEYYPIKNDIFLETYVEAARCHIRIHLPRKLGGENGGKRRLRLARNKTPPRALDDAQ